MINSIEIQRFKRFERPIRLEGLGRVNYLVGKNNSGKSSFLQAVLLACLYRDENGSHFSNSSFPDNLAALREYYSDEDISSPIRVVLNDGTQEKTIIEGSWRQDGNTIRKINTGEGKIPRALYIPCNVQMSKSQDISTVRQIENEIRGLGILSVSRIASFVYHWRRHLVDGTWNKEPSNKFSDFRDMIHDEFQIEILRPEPNDDNVHDFKYLEQKKERRLYLLGSGAQNIIYLLAAIYYLTDYDLILVDEPELHLHPGLQKRLGKLFRILSRRFDVQFIVATQSPFAISNLTVDDSVYILKTGVGDTVSKENSFVKVLVSLELGGEPSDVGAPENFVLVEEASMQIFLRRINDRLYRAKAIQFISCGGINRVPDKEMAIQNIVDHNLLLKCTPIYLSKYFIVTDKLTEAIKKDPRIIDMREKLHGRFIEICTETLEAAYPEKYLEKFMAKNAEKFENIQDANVKKSIANWIGAGQTQEEQGRRKFDLAEFVGNTITQEDFGKALPELAIIFQ